MTRNFTWQQFTGMITLLLALSGLIWQAAQQSGKIDNHAQRLEATETRQDLDHDTLIKVTEGVKYLVDREKAREARGER